MIIPELQRVLRLGRKFNRSANLDQILSVQDYKEEEKEEEEEV